MLHIGCCKNIKTATLVIFKTPGVEQVFLGAPRSAKPQQWAALKSCLCQDEGQTMKRVSLVMMVVLIKIIILLAIITKINWRLRWCLVNRSPATPRLARRQIESIHFNRSDEDLSFLLSVCQLLIIFGGKTDNNNNNNDQDKEYVGNGLNVQFFQEGPGVGSTELCPLAKPRYQALAMQTR